MEEGQPRNGGGVSWGPPPPAPAEATRAAGRRPTTTHQQRQQQVKVKHIVTREVTTDVANFKDVVQRLTGKDSAAARAAVVAAGAVVNGTSYWSASGTATAAAGCGATTSTGVTSSGAIVIEDNVAGVGAAGATPMPTMFLSEEDMRRWWREVMRE